MIKVGKIFRINNYWSVNAKNLEKFFEFLTRMTRIKETRKFSEKANIKKEGAKNEKRERQCASFCLRFLQCAKGVSQKTKKSLSYLGIQSGGKQG